MSVSIKPATGLRAEDRKALTVGSVVLAALLLYAAVIRPALDDARRDRSALDEQKAVLARENALVAAAPGLPAALAAARRALASELPRLFEGDSVAATAGFTSFVGDAAVATGVHLTTLDARAAQSDGGLTQLTVDLRGESTWAQALMLMKTLETSSRLLSIQAVRMERGARGGPLGGDLVALSATVNAYARGAR